MRDWAYLQVIARMDDRELRYFQASQERQEQMRRELRAKRQYWLDEASKNVVEAHDGSTR